MNNEPVRAKELFLESEEERFKFLKLFTLAAGVAELTLLSLGWQLLAHRDGRGSTSCVRYIYEVFTGHTPWDAVHTLTVGVSIVAVTFFLFLVLMVRTQLKKGPNWDLFEKYMHDSKQDRTPTQA